jgi:uncharacterized protein with GYD domain
MPTYIGLVRFKKPPTKEMVAKNLGMVEKDRLRGLIVREMYWTLGRYDGVMIFDAPDEKAAMKSAIMRAENVHVETMVAVPLEEASKLLEQ